MSSINMKQFIPTTSSLSYITDKQLTAVINNDKEAALKKTLGQKIFDCILALFGKDTHGKVINELFKLVHPEGGKEVTFLTPKARFCMQVEAAIKLKTTYGIFHFNVSSLDKITEEQEQQLNELFPIDFSKSVITPIKDMPISIENLYSTDYIAQQRDTDFSNYEFLGQVNKARLDEEYIKPCNQGFSDDKFLEQVTEDRFDGERDALADLVSDSMYLSNNAIKIMKHHNDFSKAAPLFAAQKAFDRIKNITTMPLQEKDINLCIQQLSKLSDALKSNIVEDAHPLSVSTASLQEEDLNALSHQLSELSDDVDNNELSSSIEDAYARSISTPLFFEGESLLTEIEKAISEKANEAKTKAE